MRPRSTSSIAAISPRTSPIAGASASAGSFKVVPARQRGGERRPTFQGAAIDTVPSGEDRAGGDWDPRVHEQERQAPDVRVVERHQVVAPARSPRGAAEQAGGHVRAQSCRDFEQLLLRGFKAPPATEQPQRRRRIGRSAPDPGGDRQSLVQPEQGAARDAEPLAERRGGTKDQVLARQGARESPAYLQAEIVGFA
jgi:hypothetical protein